MKQEPEQFFQDLKKDVSSYIELKVEILKLETYERAGKGISALSYGMILALLIFFLILFISVAVGFFIGERLGSAGIGFSIVAAFYLLMAGLVFLLKDKIRSSILNSVIAAFMTPNKKNNYENATNTFNEIKE